MKRFWLSWYSVGAFTYEGPWWISGMHGGRDVICAAVIAESLEEAKEKIVSAHHDESPSDWRFAEEKEYDWAPFGSRFKRQSWMQWVDLTGS
jgi:hypothetical protein